MKGEESELWVTVQECIGIPCFPNGAANVRNKLERLSRDKPELKRKRIKSKGYEYHISILPPIAQQHFGLSAQPKHDSSLDGRMSDNKQVWCMIFERMDIEQQQIAIDTFFTGGLNALLPTVMEQFSARHGDNKEILRSGAGIPEGSPSASVEPQPHETKKAG